MASVAAFTCNICGTHNTDVAEGAWHREMTGCSGCRSNPRFRGVILALQQYLYGETETAFKDVQVRKHIKLLGVSDDKICADLFQNKFSYTNTYYHKEPYLDLCSTASCIQYLKLDAIICSDVIEHTSSPPYDILSNMYMMLRVGGFVVLSAPTFHMSSTIEWYPAASSLQTVQENGKYCVNWTNIRGVNYVDTSPSFHGGPGDTLEMRLISHQDLLSIAERVGFQASILDFDPLHGYYWPLYPPNHLFPYPGDSRVLILKRV
jgi:hypothetical protein